MKKQKIAMTGRLRVGKDHAAEHCGGRIIGFADPIYEIGEFLTGLGVEHKDSQPFLRKLYQLIGQWGRGEINEQYPLNIERGIVTGLVKAGFFQHIKTPVSWELWGTPNIWIESLVKRAAELDDTRIFCTNVRYKNELDRLQGEGWDHFHVLCSRQTYEERLRVVNLSINDPKLSDMSEQLAAAFDNAVINILKTQPTGDKLKVIWNDHRTSPSDRFFSVEEFKQYVENNECEPEYSYIEPTDSPESAPSDSAADAAPGPCDVEERPEVQSSPSPKDRNPADRRRKRKSAKKSQ